ASSGLPFLIVPVGYFSDVKAAVPDQPRIEALADEVGAAGVYLFTFETLHADATLHARAFAPGAGIPEDPVTGTASGAVAAYLERMGAFDEMPEEMTFEQGHAVDRPGEVSVRVGDDGISVGGQAVTALEGELVVPPKRDDDIVEA
ncbi:MAG: PhzF family phenazine biosynthesis isomerase, partial [Halobacteriales archaeon]|nr:PhzF family phenazine biosynthesis isomerase [Halobacteriales archaeon]